MSKAKPKRGRPSTYSEKDAAEIVTRLAKGEPLAAICRDDWLPAVRTVSDWRRDHTDFNEAFLTARDDGFDALAAECLEIADDGSADYKLAKGEGDEINVDSEHIQRSKLRIETRLKLLAKWDPRRYGDRVIHAGDQEAPVTIAMIERRIVRPNP